MGLTVFNPFARAAEPEPEITTRWLINRDMPAVLAIDRESFPPEDVWTDADFRHVLKQRNSMGTVAEYLGQVVGFTIYESHPNYIDVINLAVARRSRGVGVGRAIVNRLREKIGPDWPRTELLTLVRETNLDAQRFLAATGWEATEVVRQPYINRDDDGYLFRFRAELPASLLIGDRGLGPITA